MKLQNKNIRQLAQINRRSLKRGRGIAIKLEKGNLPIGKTMHLRAQASHLDRLQSAAVAIAINRMDRNIHVLISRAKLKPGMGRRLRSFKQSYAVRKTQKTTT